MDSDARCTLFDLGKGVRRLETRGELTQRRARAAFNRRSAEDFIIGVPRRYTYPSSCQQTQSKPMELPPSIPPPAAGQGKLSAADLRLVPTLMLFAAGILLGLTFSLNRIAASDGIPFIPYVFWQALGAGLLMLAFSLIFRRPPGLSFSHLRVYAVMGLLGMSLPMMVVNFVATKLPAGVVGLQQTLVPMLTYAFALLLRIDKVNALKLTGLAVGLGAVLVVVLPRASLPSPDMTIWVLVSFLTPLCYGIANVLISILRPPQSSSLALGAAILLTGSIYMGLVMLGMGEWWWFEGDAGAMGNGDWALIGVVFINAIFFWLMLEIIRLAGPVFFSVQNYITTLAGIGWGILIHDEAHSLWIWLALVLLFFGLALVIVGSLKTQARP